MSKEFDLQRYQDAQHQMQSGVAMDLGDRPEHPKHVRVGINTALCDHCALTRLLIAKGVFTEEEYIRGIREQMEAEVDRYKKILRDKFGADNIELI
jgi:hypothetical protein